MDFVRVYRRKFVHSTLFKFHVGIRLRFICLSILACYLHCINYFLHFTATLVHARHGKKQRVHCTSSVSLFLLLFCITHARVWCSEGYVVESKNRCRVFADAPILLLHDSKKSGLSVFHVFCF